jgi:hypothetical protein
MRAKIVWGAAWLVIFPVACVAVMNAFVGVYIAAIMLWGSLGESSTENALALAAAAVALLVLKIGFAWGLYWLTRRAWRKLRYSRAATVPEKAATAR